MARNETVVGPSRLRAVAIAEAAAQTGMATAFEAIH
jgi:hypothetical protein